MEFTSFSFCEEIESFRKRFEGKESTIPSRCHGRGYRAQGAVMGSGIRARKKKKKKKKSGGWSCMWVRETASEWANSIFETLASFQNLNLTRLDQYEATSFWALDSLHFPWKRRRFSPLLSRGFQLEDVSLSKFLQDLSAVLFSFLFQYNLFLKNEYFMLH